MSGPGEGDFWRAYLDAVSQLIALPIDDAHREATLAQLALNAEIAKPLLEFEMPEGTDIAPVFRP